MIYAEKRHIGRLLKEKRKAKGWTLQQLGNKVGVSGSVVHVAEAKVGTEGHYFRIGKALGIDVYDELKQYRKNAIKQYGPEMIVRFLYFVGNQGYKVEGYLLEPKGKYHNGYVVQVTKGKELLKRHPTFDRVFVAKHAVEFV